MPISTVYSNIVDQYIHDLTWFEDFFDETDFQLKVDEISTYLEHNYGLDEKQKFLNSMVEDDPKRKKTIGRMRAYLYSLRNRVGPKNTQNKSPKKTAETKISNCVFIVHGHDDEAKESVARFIGNLGLEPIILHEQPNSGKTIIEKLESNAESISFAVVLLTPDDKVVTDKPDEYEYRARQNVIYELGFFNAKIGRDKVCVLKKGDVEILSDYLAVVYVEMDKSGGWRNQLAREINAAGLTITPENFKKALLS